MTVHFTVVRTGSGTCAAHFLCMCMNGIGAEPVSPWHDNEVVAAQLVEAVAHGSSSQD